MIDDQTQRTDPEPRPRRNLAHIIKWIILIFLVVLVLVQLGAGELDQLREGVTSSWLILLLKLLLIGIVLYLMRVQRSLRCEITQPTGCATVEYDPNSDTSVIVVRGTASGSIFASYELTLELSGTPLAVTIDYPGGGASGVTPVNNGELGRIHVETLEPTTGYTVILTVHDTAGGNKTCTSLFDLQDRVVYIEAIGKIPAQAVGAHPTDPAEPLKLAKESPGAPSLPDDPEDSVGGSISIEGGADVFGCDRQMNEWALQHRAVAAGNDPWEADAAGAWDDIRVLPIFNTDPNHPRRYLALGTLLLPNFVVNGDLTRQWVTRQILQTVSPLTYAPRRVTRSQDWDTGSLNGRFTVRLRVRHDQMAGGGIVQELYDAVTVWIDNRQIECAITGLEVAGGGALDPCAELQLSQFVSGGTKVGMDIVGRAWDPIILGSYPNMDAPNDNFGHYDLDFKKDGSSAWEPIASNQENPVPADRTVALPAPPNDVGTLTTWDVVAALDAGPKPPGGSPPPAPYPKIYRGDRCAYLIRLFVTDTTWLNDTGDHHDAEFFWPFCIENDLSPDDPFPVP